MEEARCKEMAEAAQHDLDEALPALEEAVKVRMFSVLTPTTSVCCCSAVTDVLR